MARTKTVLGAGARLTDYLGASLLARVYPVSGVEDVLNAHGVNSQRVRSLPAVSGLYFCIALSLYPEVAYEQVFTVISQGHSWMSGGDGAARIAKSSVSQMRAKLGAAPLLDLLNASCVPLCTAKEQPEAFYRGLRLMAIDGSNFELPDEPDNVAAFGYPGSRTGHAGYPQAQCAVLVECASHAIIGANIDAYRASEWSVCEPLLARLDATMLCLADRGFNGHNHWVAARKTGAHLLWRCANNRILPVDRQLDDGSFLSTIYPSAVLSKKQRAASAQGVEVRVIEYTLPVPKPRAGDDKTQAAQPTQPARYRLLTSLLDDRKTPALELAALYHERWEVEGVFDELKTHLVQSRRVLRSKKPDLVRQEFYGWVLAHYAVRWLMHGAAQTTGGKIRDLSFTAHVQIMRVAQPQSGAFPPRARAKAKVVV